MEYLTELLAGQTSPPPPLRTGVSWLPVILIQGRGFSFTHRLQPRDEGVERVGPFSSIHKALG